ncbi:GAK system XXXCH domain-containing protein [Pseudodesulfovibrio sp. JC047]|uniref:GAK system XXXCH domain-containing protein n=1 Tax=Pseudodesulfovibrio sp. JC047 TaxID=2683199 RepID=UPI0013CFB024|nr:GAK system XXXCH domain-containing protein [Pseudodesulfovibrio sp. JC047]NDV19286.1 GAK system XXXCH domain-containing protein [Pseudodesulfovibrio sp. JC047]
MSRGTQFFKHMDDTDLPGFFRELADALENGGTGELTCVDDFKKFKIKGRIDFGQVRLDMKFSSAQECLAPPEIECEECGAFKPAYKDLKKQMKSSFKTLVKMIHEGVEPPRPAVESFLDDAALMVTYAGYGDEYYDAFTAACSTFREAYESGDITRMHTAIDALLHEKGRCHAKYA